jgi:glycosyltransferase involved in cell wall biosynthesis
LRPLRQLVRIIRQHGYRLLHAHTPRSVLVAGLASRWTGMPLVYHVHSPTSRDSTRPWQNRTNAAIERCCFPLACELIAVSESIGRHLQSLGVSADKVAVVPNGVPVRRPRPPRPAAARQWLFGTVALFRPRKGIEVLLEAVAILRREGLPIRLTAVGGFETSAYERQVLQRMTDLNLTDSVAWTGFRQDVDAELAAMDVFVLPSLFGEGLPMVVLEAMATGVPVIAARVEGVPEVIRDGREGLLVEPGNATDLARAMARFVRGEVDWSRMRRAALRRHAAGFSDRAMAAGVARVYRRVLDKQAMKIRS